ncbi:MULTISPECIES: ABC transporter permease [Bradyrhizobium]|jgi:NitT/TauT family transport system permease protein|uniref:ABC transporter permease n=1 Tax=Bradyrhizobium TaxID=374 RepID=UPI0003F4DD47|nr:MULTISPECIES: ABC transporter permease [Bradyrhizobium]AUC94322.1 ABC transporter permease [Bradyrhizobium sp. SK17]KIU48978.1 ABC transporter permease [Bradyrhizobium elkanii]MBK5652479.1 ABC transporter permease [Rhizobium sp.]OCX29175.1 ABC transporter permease [Bradyrhizobium sp. UASWS1016]
MSQPTQTGTGIAGATGIASGLSDQGGKEVAAIIAVALLVIGGGELLLRLFEVPRYILPTPSAIASVFFSHEIATICEHYSYTLIELFAGYAVGASIGLVLAAVITQFPFVEKVITPYILLLVTTPMLALVPLLILNFGFGFTPRIIAVALASGPMVMINAATGFRRVDAMKIALARSCGASTLQIFTKIRIPMAMPMVIVGLMIGAIFGMITAVGAEMSGGGFGLGSRLTTYSSTLRMPEFFACIVILAVTGITIYAFFFWLGKRLAGWES